MSFDCPYCGSFLIKSKDAYGGNCYMCSKPGCYFIQYSRYITRGRPSMLQDIERQDEFIDWLQERGLNNDTIKTYLTGAKQYIQFIKSIKTIKYHKKIAEQGNSDAQFKLGKYHQKIAEQGNSDAQFKLGKYQKIAEQGNSDAQFKLGDIYYYGEGVEHDYAKAFFWYKKAAEQENSDAQFKLGDIYYYGEGVEQDYAKAFFWYKKAAEQENSDAQFKLGNMYYNGEGVEQDSAKASFWYKKAKTIESVIAIYKCIIGDCFQFSKNNRLEAFLALKAGNESNSEPPANIDLKIDIFKKDGDKITSWAWEEINK